MILFAAFVSAALAAANVCSDLHHVTVIDAQKDVIPFASDFGSTTFRLPGCVVQPTTLDEVQRTIKFARLRGLTITTRGNGHSTGGQSLSENNIVIDTSKLNTITIDTMKHTATVGAGARWVDLIAAAYAAKLRPNAFVDTITETTFGGIFSVGGTSAMSLRLGVAIDQALLSFDCVDGRGNIHEGVSKDHDRDLFVAYRGGLGQFCVATRFVVKLAPLVAVAKQTTVLPATLDISGTDEAHVVQYARVFFTAEAAAQFLLTIGRVATVDGFEMTAFKNSKDLLDEVNPELSLAILGAGVAAFMTPMAFAAAVKTVFIAFVYDIAPLDAAAINAALPSPVPSATSSGLLPVTSMSFIQYASRAIPTITRSKANQAWVAPKVLRSLFVPVDPKLPAFVNSVTTLIQTAPFYSMFPSCQLNFKFVDPAIVSKHSLLRVPRSAALDVSFEVSCLDDLSGTGSISPKVLPARAIANPIVRVATLAADIDALLKTAFTIWPRDMVKQYPVDTMLECWASHFGDAWKYVLPLKERFDPCAILGRSVGIFPQSATRTCPGLRGAFKCSFDGEHDYSDSISLSQSADLKIYDVI